MEDKLDNSSNNIDVDPLFWLPSDFLSDNDNDNDDIFIGQDNLNLPSNTPLPTHFPYDFTELTRPFTSENKWALSGSPQSILSPVLSNESPNGPSSPTAPFAENHDQSWNLICAAAGEVKMWKMRNESVTPSNIFTPLPYSNKYFNNHVKQSNGSVWSGVSAEYGCGFGGNARCGRAQTPFQCGWPALPIRNQHFNVNGCVSRPSLVLVGGMRNVAGGGGGLKKKCAGTGVFLPRTCPDTPPSSRVNPGCPASLTPSRPAPTLNVQCNYDVMSKAPAQPTVGGVNPDHGAMLVRTNAVLANWRNEMNMMGNRAMNCKMHLPEEWSY